MAIHLERLTWLIHHVGAAAIEAKSTVILDVAFSALGFQLLIGKCISGSKFQTYSAGKEVIISGIISTGR